MHTWGLVRAPRLCRDLLASGALAGKLGAACCAGPGGVQLGSTISPETQPHPSALQPKGLGLARARLRGSTATPLPARLLGPELPLKAVWGHAHALCTSGLQVPVPVKHHRAVSLQLISAHGGSTLHPPPPFAGVLHPVLRAASTQSQGTRPLRLVTPPVNQFPTPCPTFPLAPCLPHAAANQLHPSRSEPATHRW